MQAVILCAGRGTRMGALTTEVPKPLLVRNGKTLLERTLDIVPNEIDEIVLVIGYLGDRIQEAIGESYRGKRVTYVRQPELNGTAGALWCARDILHDRFIVLMADDEYDPADVATATISPEWTLFVKEVPNMYRGGNVIVDSHGAVVRIEEGNDHGGLPGQLNIGLYTLDTRIFDHDMVRASAGSNEYGLPQTMVAASHHLSVPCHTVRSKQWVQVTVPEDLCIPRDVPRQ